MSTKNKKASKKSALISEEDLKPENMRIRISMMVPVDLMDAYRAEAQKLGIGYQTLMQLKLREALEHNSLEKRLEKLERKLKGA